MNLDEAITASDNLTLKKLISEIFSKTEESVDFMNILFNTASFVEPNLENFNKLLKDHGTYWSSSKVLHKLDDNLKYCNTIYNKLVWKRDHEDIEELRIHINQLFRIKQFIFNRYNILISIDTFS